MDEQVDSNKKLPPDFSADDLALLQDAITLNERIQKVLKRKATRLEELKTIRADLKGPCTRLKKVWLKKREAKVFRKWDRENVEFQQLFVQISKTEHMIEGVLARCGISLEEVEEFLMTKQTKTEANA